MVNNMNNIDRINRCISDTRAAMVKLDACDEQLEAFDTIIAEWKPIFIEYLESGRLSPGSSFLTLMYRYTSIGPEFYLHENVTGKSDSLNDNVNW